MKLWLAIFAALLSFPLSTAQGMSSLQAGRGQTDDAELSTPAASKEPADQMQAEEQQENERTADGKIRFRWIGNPWQEVIPWYADQAGFSLQTVERWPEGAFSLQDKDSYTALEALDQLNRSLAGLSEPFTLIRKRNMLMLKPVNEAISRELIDAVKPEDLDSRGAFELMSVTFDLGDLDGKQMYDDLRSQVSKPNLEYFNAFQSSNQLQVRETGARLRSIRDIIDTAKKKLADAQPAFVIYPLKFQAVETFIAVVGAQLDIPEGKNANKAGTISIVSDPLSNKLYVSGTKQMLDRFKVIAKTIDVDPNEEAEELVLEKPYLHSYPITIDPKLAYDLLGTMLEGSDARMQQDEVSGAITVLGRKSDHERVVESLASVENVKTKNFAIITMEKIPVTDALGVLQTIYRQTTSTSLIEDSSSGPVLLANSILNQIIVSGTAKEVAEIRAIATELDAQYVPVSTGPRSGVRIITMTEQDQERLLPALGDLLGSKNIGNTFNVVRPSQRQGLDERIRRGDLRDENQNKDEMIQDMLDELPSANRSKSRFRRSVPQSNLQKKPASVLQQVSALAFLALGPRRANLVSNLALFQQDGGMATSDPSAGNRRASREKKSIAGAPIEFRFNKYGLTIDTLDLDAADEIEAAIEEFLGSSTEVQLPSFFELQHRDVTEMQQMLEGILGLGDAGGGGGGDAGGSPLTGMMNNMLPGGDLLDGLLGGGGSDSVSGLEGDVTFGADVRFNTLWVVGATGNDLSQITNLIEYWDRPEGETKPELFGATRVVKVFHRGAQEVVDIIKAQRPEMVYTEQAKQGGGQNNGEVAQALKAVQALTKGGGGGAAAGGGGSGGKKQTVVLGVDAVNNTILVTGPKYMYDDILTIVEQVDVEPGPFTTEVIPGIHSTFLLETLLQTFKGKLTLSSGADGTPASGTSKEAQSPQRNEAPAQIQELQRVQRALSEANRGQQGNGEGRGAGANGGGRGATGGGGGRGANGGGGRGANGGGAGRGTGGGGRGATGGGGGRGAGGGGATGGRGNATGGRGGGGNRGGR